METTIRVIQFDAFPTGTYQPLYSRPYVAEIHGHALDDLANRIERVTRTNPTTRIGLNPFEFRAGLKLQAAKNAFATRTCTGRQGLLQSIPRCVAGSTCGAAW